MVPVLGPARSIDLLVGQRLESVGLGHALVLGFSGDRQVVIETVARLTGPEGDADVEPGEDPSDALATLLGDVVRSAARATATGELIINFTGGAELTVGPDADVESWAVTGPDGYLIVCQPGGDLAVWGDATQH